MDELTYLKDELLHQRLQADKERSSKNGWSALCVVSVLVFAFQFYTWASTPDKVYEVADSQRPEVIFHYRYWNDHHVIRYIWGKDDNGDSWWVSVDEKGRRDGGSMPKASDVLSEDR